MNIINRINRINTINSTNRMLIKQMVINNKNKKDDNKKNDNLIKLKMIRNNNYDIDKFINKNKNEIFLKKNFNINKDIQINLINKIINTNFIDTIAFGSNKGELDNIKFKNDDDIKLIICTCIYKRKELTKFCITEWLKHDIYKIIVVYSEEDDYNNLKDVISDKLVIVKYDNLPLSNKWNYSVKTAQKYNPDAIMIMGSDDIFTSEYITKAKYYLNRGIEYISNNIWANIIYFKDKILLFSAYYIKRRDKDGIGTTRIYSSSVLNKINWDLYLFSKPINSCLDLNSFNKIKIYITKIRFDITNNFNTITLKIPTDDTAITIKEVYNIKNNKDIRINFKIFDYNDK